MQENAKHPLESLFRPRSIALVGASERSLWSRMTYENLNRFAFPGDIHLVNRTGGTVYGQKAAARCVDIGKPVDLAILMVPETAILEAVDDLAKAGVQNAVILTSGFGEMGIDGVVRQEALASAAKSHGVRFLGPNCLGFVNYLDRVPVWTGQRRTQRSTGSVGFVSQSGAIAALMADYAFHQNLPLSFLISTGNEADVDVASVIDFLAEEPNTKVIGVFLEGVRDPQRFAQAAWKAFRAGKPVIILKVGKSEQSARVAQAHTGSLVGDDRVFDAACRRYGMVRVDAPETVVSTCAILSRVMLIEGGLALAALSGGMCEVAADCAAAEGLILPPLASETVESLRESFPAFGTPQNPLDLTGAAMLNPDLIEHALRCLAQDPGLGVIACVLDAPEIEDQSGFVAKAFAAIARGVEGSVKPALVLSNLSAQVTKLGRELINGLGITYVASGVDRGIASLARASAWSILSRELSHRGDPLEAVEPGSNTQRMTTEREALEHLAHHGVPVIPTEIVASPEQAVFAARAFAGPVSLKILSPQIPHKTEVGGVILNCAAAAAGDAYRKILDRITSRCPNATIEGVLVSPMRLGGVELFVGVARDLVWGPVIALGVGGVFVELIQDSALRLLPVTAEDVLGMLAELRGSSLLDGFRGAAPVNRRSVAEAVVRIGNAALALGPDLVALDVNPLFVKGESVEALDALAIWNS